MVLGNFINDEFINNDFVNDETINIGDKVDLVTPTGEAYRTMIEDKLDSRLYLVGVPIRRGVYMHAEENDELYLVFYRETGRYIAHMRVAAVEKRETLRYLWLVQKTRIQKDQRRGAYRLPVNFEVQVFEYDEAVDLRLLFMPDKEKPATLELVKSNDISITGVALITRKIYEVDDKCLLGLHFSRTSANIGSRHSAKITPELCLTATVKRCTPWRMEKTYVAGMHFFGATDSIRDSISRYVLTEQQRQLKLRKRFD